MKFCRSTLFEAGRTLFMKNWKIYSRKTGMALTVKLFFNSFRRLWRTYGRQVSRKTVSCSLRFDLGVYMRRITYDSATVACSKRLDSGERCEVKKAMKSRGGLGREVREPLSPLLLPRFYFFALLFTSHRSSLSERLEQATATVNISVFIEQRNISFQNDISLKTMRLGVLPWEKLKTSLDSRRNRDLGPASLGSRRAIADLFGVMFIAWMSQKASKVHKLLSQSWP